MPDGAAIPGGTTRRCLSPWTYVETRPNGDVTLCCVRHPIGNLTEMSLAEWRESPPARALRASLLSGDLDPTCAKCRLVPLAAPGELAADVRELHRVAAEKAAARQPPPPRPPPEPPPAPPWYVYRGGFGLWRRLRALGRRDAAAPPPPVGSALQQAHVAHLEALVAGHGHAAAMQLAAGGDWAQIGAIEAALVRAYGLPEAGYLIDVGCGAGRLAEPLAASFRGAYLGTDLVPALVDHARRSVPRPDWRFEAVDGAAIPEADGAADMVALFSVLTHLPHAEGYALLAEAARVLKPGGRVLFSFLDFGEPAHWDAFAGSVRAAQGGIAAIPNVFIARDWLPVWAFRLGLEVADVRAAADRIVPEGNLGQALCVLKKPG